jgi:transcriptional regulator NrdR family protein
LNALEGERNLALAMCDSLENLSSTENVQSIYFASIYAALGDKNEMYKYLNQALETRENYIHFIRYNAALSPYKDEEQFQDFIGKLWMPPQKNY